MAKSMNSTCASYRKDFVKIPRNSADLSITSFDYLEQSSFSDWLTEAFTQSAQFWTQASSEYLHAPQ